MSDYKNRTRRVAVCLITDNDENVLMGLRNDCKKWTCPGGHLDKGEDPYQGALRELHEEAGLDADNIKLVKVEWKKERNLLLYLFTVEPKEGQIPDASGDPDKECDDWHYIDPNSVIEDLHVPIEENLALKYWANS